MTFQEAVDVLRNGKEPGPQEREAIEKIRWDLVDLGDLERECALAKLTSELLHSTSPAFSYQLLCSIYEAAHFSQGDKLESSFVLRTLFINEILESKTVKDGLRKCMVALGNCTKVTGD